LDAQRAYLRLVVCEDCGFVFNSVFDSSKIGYGDTYDNSQCHSPSFVGHVNGLVEHILNDRRIRNSRILEVGCGQGAFLRRLVENLGTNNSGWGFDPSYAGPSVDLEGRLRYEACYYSRDSLHVSADIVIARHLIEHVPDPLDLLSNVKNALKSSSLGSIFIETPCIEWIFSHLAFWDFFYEHCSYFTKRSLSNALNLAGFKLHDVRHVFEGQYLWIEASLTNRVCPKPSPEHQLVTEALAFGKAENKMIQSLQSKIESLRPGGIALWGAASKGVTIANLIDPSRELISCLVDLNPNKQGCFVPVTGHPIVSPQDPVFLGLKTAIVVNPNYFKEISIFVTERKLGVNLINIEN
jgi:SAM-dependent methyltransferase